MLDESACGKGGVVGMAQRARRADMATRACGAETAAREITGVIVGLGEAIFGGLGGRFAVPNSCMSVGRRTGERDRCESAKNRGVRLFVGPPGGAILGILGGSARDPGGPTQFRKADPHVARCWSAHECEFEPISRACGACRGAFCGHSGLSKQ